MSTDAHALLARTTLVVRRGPYALGTWRVHQASAVYTALTRADATPSFVVRDDLELTACVPQAELSELPAPRRLEPGWCLLTLDMVMDWNVVGVLAALTAALARAGVPVGAVTAFSRDHVLVPARLLEPALDALRPLCAAVELVD